MPWTMKTTDNNDPWCVFILRVQVWSWDLGNRLLTALPVTNNSVGKYSSSDRIVLKWQLLSSRVLGNISLIFSHQQSQHSGDISSLHGSCYSSVGGGVLAGCYLLLFWVTQVLTRWEESGNLLSRSVPVHFLLQFSITRHPPYPSQGHFSFLISRY